MVETQGFPVVEAGTLGEIVPVNYGPRPEIYGTMKEIQKGYMPQQGRIIFVSSHGWQTMEMLDMLGRVLYRESFFVRRAKP